MRPLPTLPLLLLALAASAAPAAAETEAWKVDPARSVFAVLTHKAGIAARLAHDHLVVAPPAARVELEFDREAPEGARLAIAFPVAGLEIDEAAARARWGPRLAELGAISDATLAPTPEKDRPKVRDAMLGASQLDAGRHPEIRAELLSLARRGGAGERTALGWTARVRLTVRGKSAESDLALRWTLDGDELTAEGLGELRFTDLGIEPYSAMLGAVRNADLFHLYLSLVARPATTGPATP